MAAAGYVFAAAEDAAVFANTPMLADERPPLRFLRRRMASPDII
jgi:hypothetical protein